ncbi:MAG TPA: 8-oxoguanine deaminase [Anaerolineales bacterium]|nr:8-oxoguanine deaminase [Anaerolineae bacterium]HIQ02134.1 8-oxoguanine deaminase [Anaerolineales bacterium]
MSTLLVRDADLLVTMDDADRRIRRGGLFVRDNRIERVGPTAELPAQADQVIDARGMILLPGLVNTHHHLYQTLTRAVPAAQDATLFGWLKTLYPIWANLTPEAVYTSALVGLAELILSGCTTAADHLYIYPNGCRIDDEIRAAREIGIRFHASRGSMSLGESKGGLPPDRVVEDEDFILKDTQRAIETYHEPEPYGMVRIVVAPCSPFSVTPDLMREGAALARSYGVRLHTHLAETLDEEAFCLEQFGHRPVGYAEELGWVGDDVWYAHGVHVNEPEIGLLARTGTGVCHCPSSNMRLGSGIAPVRAYLDAGVRVGLGVDGSASNDSSHLLAEARMALLLQRVSGDPAGLSAREALWLATRGGAQVLGRDDIGQLTEGFAADFIGFRLDRLDYAGALHDPLAALVFCTPQRVDLSVINGRVVVEEGHLQTVDLGPVIERHNRIARGLMGR